MTEKKPIYKRKWFLIIAGILVLAIIGSMLGDDKPKGAEVATGEPAITEDLAAKEAELKKKEEELAAKEAELQERSEEATEEATEEISDEDIKLPISIIKMQMEENFSELTDVVYEEEDNAFLLYPKEDLSESLMAMPLLYDDDDYRGSWDFMVDNLANMSETIRKNHGSGVQIHLVNPANEDNYLLSILDGVVLYNVIDDF